MTHLEHFAQYRSSLYRQACAILGNAMDAEDLLQDTFLRWQQTALTEIKSPKAFLSTVLKHLCLNHLQSARVRREKGVATFTTMPTSEVSYALEPSESIIDSLTVAFQLLLERLSPKERLVLLLREVFDYEYEEIAVIIRKSNANCRQMLLRAKKYMTSGPSRFAASPEQLDQLVRQFALTCSDGDLEGLVSVLS